jgi:hypothetical protein
VTHVARGFSRASLRRRQGEVASTESPRSFIIVRRSRTVSAAVRSAILATGKYS